MPGADPGEGFLNTNFQLFSTDDPAPGAVPTNQGFVINFKAAIASDLAKHFKDTLPGHGPVARSWGCTRRRCCRSCRRWRRDYAVCDQLVLVGADADHSEPRLCRCRRPARAISTTTSRCSPARASSAGCSDKNIDWAIYGYNRDPLTRLDFTDTQHAGREPFRPFPRLPGARCGRARCRPTPFSSRAWAPSGNSQHPNYDVALRRAADARRLSTRCATGPGWNDTLLLITYDEHGGNYDHVPPPWGATPPGDGTVGELASTSRASACAFRRY